MARSQCGEALEQVDRLERELEALRDGLEQARQAEASREADLLALSQAERAAADAVQPSRADSQRLVDAVAEAEAELTSLEAELARLKSRDALAHSSFGSHDGGLVAAGVGSCELDVDDELRALGKKELDEIRSFPKPPMQVRRALELVEALFRLSLVADPSAAGDEGCVGKLGGLPCDRSSRRLREAFDGVGAKMESAPQLRDADAAGATWPDVQALLQRSDFIPRLLQLKPHDLAEDPSILHGLCASWPALMQRPPAPIKRERPCSRAERRAAADVAVPAPVRSEGTRQAGFTTLSRPGTATSASAGPRGQRRRAATDLSSSTIRRVAPPQHASSQYSGTELTRSALHRLGRNAADASIGSPVAERIQARVRPRSSVGQSTSSPRNKIAVARSAAATGMAVMAQSSADMLGASENHSPDTDPVVAVGNVEVVEAPSSCGAAANPLGAAGCAGCAGPLQRSTALTAEAVDFASRPCGILYRWCGAMLRSALALLRAREELSERVAAQARRLNGLRSEMAAVLADSQTLEDHHSEILRRRRVAEAQFKAANAARVRCELEMGDTTSRLAAARERAEEVALAIKQELADAERQAREREERRVARVAARREALARASAAVERALAEQKQATTHECFAWIHHEPLEFVKPIEFALHSTEVGVETNQIVQALVRALSSQQELRLHIAGHTAADEDPRLSSVRAQAVGAALIGAGAPPNRLRAKGYGATVPLTPPQRSKLRLRSMRRVAIHAIPTIRTAQPITFAHGSCALSDGSAHAIRGIAALLVEHPQMRLSVEGHADPTEGQPRPHVGDGGRATPPAATPRIATRGPGAKCVGVRPVSGAQRTKPGPNSSDLRDGTLSNRGSTKGEFPSIADGLTVQALAQQRSLAVCEALCAAGVSETRLVQHAFSASLPVADSHTEEGRAANRRVQVLAIPDVVAAT